MAKTLTDPNTAKLLMFKDQAGIDKALETIKNDDNHTPDAIKIVKGKLRYELLNPNDAADPLEVNSFLGVLLFGKPAWLPPFAKKDSKDSKDRTEEFRATMVMRLSNGLPRKLADGSTNPAHIGGRKYPESLWFSKTSIYAYKKFLKEAKEVWNLPYWALLVSFELEQGSGNGFTWSKIVIRVVRALTEEERAYIEPFVLAVKERDAKFQREDIDDSYEEEAMGITVTRPAARTEEAEVAAESRATTRKHEIDEDEDEAPAKPPKAPKAPKAPKTPPAPAPVVAAADDEEDDDEDEAETPAPAPAPAKPPKAPKTPPAPAPVAADDEDDDEADDEDEEDDDED